MIKHNIMGSFKNSSVEPQKKIAGDRWSNAATQCPCCATTLTNICNYTYYAYNNKTKLLNDT